MSNPVLVEVTRGREVESRHRGAAVVMDADGAVVFSIGDIERRVFPAPRQGHPGAAAGRERDRRPAGADGGRDRAVLLIPFRRAGACGRARLDARQGGRDASCLECGAHWPMGEKAARALAVEGGRPSALHNNCSGKHSGFVCLACGLDEDPKGYIQPRPPRAARDQGRAGGHDRGRARRGRDGRGRLLDPDLRRAAQRAGARLRPLRLRERLGPERARAPPRIRASVAAHPFMVAGTGRFDTTAMEALGARAFTKTGAEAVFCGALPELGLGIALKIDDGGTRASEAVMATRAGPRFLKPRAISARCWRGSPRRSCATGTGSRSGPRAPWAVRAAAPPFIIPVVPALSRDRCGSACAGGMKLRGPDRRRSHSHAPREAPAQGRGDGCAMCEPQAALFVAWAASSPTPRRPAAIWRLMLMSTLSFCGAGSRSAISAIVWLNTNMPMLTMFCLSSSGAGARLVGHAGDEDGPELAVARQRVVELILLEVPVVADDLQPGGRLHQDMGLKFTLAERRLLLGFRVGVGPVGHDRAALVRRRSASWPSSTPCRGPRLRCGY